MTTDRDLLEALFVQQLGFAPASEVMAAGAQWLVQRETGATLKDVLRSRGLLDEKQVQLVDALVSEAIAAHGGDAATTLHSLPQRSQDSLSGLTDTLRPGATPQKLELTSTTSFDSLETPENIGVEAKGRYSFDTGRKGRMEELGRGGAGRVVVARDHFLSRDVAMKELHREITQNVKFDTLHVRNLEARFLREARVTGQLEHPAIVPVYELGRRRDGTLYYTMRRIRGRTLAQALADAPSREGRLSFVPDLLTACHALAAAHHRDVVHRDLKPQNVMLGPYGETYVMDWGLARVMGRADRARTSVQLAPDLTGGRDLGPVGTPSYMSPEQALGNRDELDARSDVWGLGAMLFEILTGRAPYVGRSPWDVLAEVRSRPPPPVLSLEPLAPPELVAVCERALAWNREHRYAHAGELALELEAFLAGRRVQAYDYSFREVASRVLKRHRGKALLAAATAVTLAVLTVVSTVGVGRERDDARGLARFFLADVAPTLADVPGTAEVLGQLSHNALEAFSRDVDPERGARDDRVLLAGAWTDVAHQRWRLGQRDDAKAGLDQAARLLTPLLAQRPDDVEVNTIELEYQAWRSDLLIDEGAEGDALTLLEGLVDRAQRLRVLAPTSVPVLAAQNLVLSRVGVLRASRGELRLAVEMTRRAREAAWAWYRLAPESPRAAAAIIDDSNDLGLALLTLGERAEALRTLRDAVGLAQKMRAQRDARSLQASHAGVLSTLARALDPVKEGDERRRVVREARRLLSDLLLADAGRNYELSEMVVLAVLDDDYDAAWMWAARIEAEQLGAEYAEPVLIAAFATGRDELIREYLRRPSTSTSTSTTATALLYGALVEVLAGNEQVARAHLSQCLELKCGDVATWLPGALLHRLEGRDDAPAALLRQLALDHPLSAGDAAGVTRGLEGLGAALKGAP